MGIGERVNRRFHIAKNAVLHGGDPVRRDDMRPDFWALQKQVAPYTQTSPERLFVLRDAVHHIANAKIPGDVVECGVWRGGSSMMAALAMQETNDFRKLWLFDTFEGMPEPGEHDRDYTGTDSKIEYERRRAQEGGWNVASLEDVQANLARTGYDDRLLRFVKGPVEESIPATAPEQIALLRLDTDFYESTRHELEHLWPRVSQGGVLIIDDYGHFEGARKAVDEYFETTPLLLTRIDYTGRMAVKT
jgi:O-methyltransferase